MGFLSGMFTGSGGQSQNQYQNVSSSQQTRQSPEYENYVNNILSKSQALGETPFQGYDVNKMFAGLNPDQQAAFAQIRNAPNVYGPYFGQAAGVLGQYRGYNPQESAQPALNEAGAATRPWDAGSGFLAQSAGAWNNPWTQASYMDPYVGGAINRANELSTRNFTEKTMPGINSQFVRGQGQLGRQNYQDFTGRAVRDLANEQSGNAQTLMNQSYWNAANQFNTDQGRMLQAGQGLGNLANQNMGALTNLASTNANITSGAVNTGIGMANAYSNLGGALSNTNLMNNQALLNVGNIEQQQAQLPLTAQYQQWQQQQQWPFQMVNFMNAAQRGLTIPQMQSGSQSTTGGSSGSSSSSPSPMGGIFGTLGAINTLGSSTDASGKTTGGLSNIWDWGKGMFGSGSGGQQYGPPAPGGGSARGGRIMPRDYARGGAVRRFAQGGPAFGAVVAPTSGLSKMKLPKIGGVGALGRVGGGGITGARSGAGSQRRFDVGGSVPVQRGLMSRRKPPMPQGMGPPGGIPMPPPGALGGLPPGLPMPPRGGPPAGALSMMR